ncbi:YdcF family protein [Novosphingobium sp.]|uniref:YdcF family protein n=1 Tax=Novosphingobium sp. TaxID=1874826 RepID=UPI0025E41D14|nr:YdcF family protein [Novosphingobium sp.]
MIRRLISIVLIVWALGFVLFAVTVPQPIGNSGTDGVVVLTGGKGRIDRGLDVLGEGWAKRLLVSGVGREVKPREFAAEYGIKSPLLACCVTLGYKAVDTRSNGSETAEWARAANVRSLRLVTSDWHMRRAALELRRSLPADIIVIEDAVPTHPNLSVLFLEYNKWIARLTAPLWEWR